MAYTILLIFILYSYYTIILIFINIVKVENRTADTYYCKGYFIIDKAKRACIKQWIKPGTTIISDCWKAHDKIE